MRSIVLIIMLLAAVLSPGWPSAAHEATGSTPAWSTRVDVHRAAASLHAATACDSRCPAVLPGFGAATAAGERTGPRPGVDRERLAWSYEPAVPSGVPRDGMT